MKTQDIDLSLPATEDIKAAAAADPWGPAAFIFGLGIWASGCPTIVDHAAAGRCYVIVKDDQVHFYILGSPDW